MERTEHKHTKDSDVSGESNDQFDDNAREVFRTTSYKPDKRHQREAKRTNIGHGRRQHEQSFKTQDQFAGSETSNTYYTAEEMPKDRDTVVIEEGACSQGEHGYGGTHLNVHGTSHKSDRQERSRNYARSQHSRDKFYPAGVEPSTHMNPTYKYSGQEEPTRVPSRGKNYITHNLGPPDHTSLPTGGNSPNIQHSVRTGSTTHTSRSPVSLPSPGSTKSSTPMHPETSSTSQSGTNRSPLIPPRLSKTSTPYKIQRTNREPLPAGTTASTSKTCTPKRDPSHNTSMQSEGVVCRICHDGDRTEVLISPCYCAGSMGLLHVSCLQRWLGSSNKTSCEICNFQFALQKKTMPISQFLKEPGTARDKKNLICDLVSFLLITPLTIVITGICIYGASHYYADKKMERSGLIGLAVSLLFLYIVWLTVAVRHNWRLWNDWRMFHQEVTLLCTPCDPGKLPTANARNPSAPVSESRDSRSTLGSIHLQSIKVSVKGPMTRYKGKKPTDRTTRTQQPEGSERMSDRASDFSRRMQSQGHSRQPIPSVSQDVHTKMPKQEDYFQSLQDEGQPIRQRAKAKQAIKYVTNDNVHYYNTEERRGDKGKRIRMEQFPQQACNHSDRQSRHSGKCSSGCSSILTEDYQQHRKCRTDFCARDQIRERKAYTDTGCQRNLTNTPNMSTGHGRNVYKTHENIITESKPAGEIKADRRQEKNNGELDIFSRGGSPPEEEKSHDDFVTKWIHDQTKVLVTEKRRSEFRDSTKSRGSSAVAVEEIPSERMHSSCETSHCTHSPNPPPTIEASKGNEKNHQTIRMPASYQIVHPIRHLNKL